MLLRNVSSLLADCRASFKGWQILLIFQYVVIGPFGAAKICVTCTLFEILCNVCYTPLFGFPVHQCPLPREEAG